MTILSRATAVAFASVLLMGTALAQNAQPSTSAPAAKSDSMAKPDAMAKPKKEMTPESMECSKEADAKGLHGKERKKFRSECKKAAKTKQ